MTRGITDNSMVYISIFSNLQEVWFHTAQTVAKGGITPFERFRQAQTSLRAVKKQANTLIYSMREEADGILYSFELSNDDRKKYNTISNRSKAHFVKWRNPIYKWRSLIWVDRKNENL